MTERRGKSICLHTGGGDVEKIFRQKNKRAGKNI